MKKFEVSIDETRLVTTIQANRNAKNWLLIPLFVSLFIAIWKKDIFWLMAAVLSLNAITLFHLSQKNEELLLNMWK